MIPITAVPNPKPASGGDMMTIRDFAEWVACGVFIDYDGMGEWSDGTYVSEALTEQYMQHFVEGMPASHLPPAQDVWVYPSHLAKGLLVRPAWATHINWYNR